MQQHGRSLSPPGHSPGSWHPLCFSSPPTRVRSRQQSGEEQRVFNSPGLNGVKENVIANEASPEVKTPPAPKEEGPDLPVTVIERRTGWQLVDLGELWRAREL